MSNLDEIKRLENDLRNNEELSKKLDEACKRIAAEKKANSDGEVVTAAARELGYDITIAALEQAQAEAEQLDPEAMEAVAGGQYNDRNQCPETENFICNGNYRAYFEDENEHDCWCATGWHCLAVTLHSESEDHDCFCWSDYTCFAINKRRVITGMQD